MSIDLTLRRIEVLLSRFENYTRPTVHIAGTNGKGSVSALLTRIFLAAELSVGRFNSPHLISVSDSIAINDSPVSASLFESVITEVRTINEEQGIHASSFEVLTVTALLIFERIGVDVVVCEVGMGGRLDATNVIPDVSILVSAITSIDLDHQAFLGSTIADITREKAGIIRRGRPIVLSPQKHDDVERVVREVSRTAQAHLILAHPASDRQWDEEIDGPRAHPFSLDPFFPPTPRPVELKGPETTYRLLLPLHGDHQLANLGTALAVLRTLVTDSSRSTVVQEKLACMSSKSLHEAVRSCTWPGRLSFHVYKPVPSTTSPSRPLKPLIILADGAHNAAASQMLVSYITDLLSSFRPSNGKRRSVSLTYILALSHSPSKTPASVLLPLLSMPGTQEVDIRTNVAFLRFSPPSGMPWVKSVAPSAMAEIARSVNDSANIAVHWNVWTSSDEITEAQDAQAILERALEWAAEQHTCLSADEGTNDGLVVVAGSLYLVADLYRLLGSSRADEHEHEHWIL